MMSGCQLRTRSPLTVEKRHINAHEVLQDIRAGLDDTALMAKYNLSAKDFRGLCAKLIETGRLSEIEFSELELLWAQKDGHAWYCPACHMPQSHQFDECPQCGIIVAKYELRHLKEAGSLQEDQFVEVPSDEPEENASIPTVRDEQTPAFRCPACNTLVSEGAKFCESCGARLKD